MNYLLTSDRNSLKVVLCVLLAAALLSGCGAEHDSAFESIATLDEERIVSADAEPENWLSHGRTYDEQRFSPLAQVNRDTVQDLSLAWYFDTDTNRGHEASSIVVDGVMFTTAPWSLVYALDAKTGELLWKYDPQVPRSWGAKACCDVVNRGVAVWEGTLYLGTLDGYLVALNARTGEEIWRTLTIDASKPYTITGAPRIAKNLVIIGNGGAEYGVRGYVSAYDATSGELVWRFYTVPGNPADGFESDAMRKAAATWSGSEWWNVGGGGTVWDSMAYDANLGLLYIGTGNGSPWTRFERSPGGGDNLYLSSIVALKIETGEYVWHYQTTPGDTWDYTATQHLILAELRIDGQVRKVVMQAPKNGFFYVLDRKTGKLISANNYVPVNWASGIDLDTGRPIENLATNFRKEAKLVLPSPFGGHNWQPMAYSPDTGLVYIPAQEIPFNYGPDSDYQYQPGFWNTAIDIAATLPPRDLETVRALRNLVKGHLIAWDPVRQQQKWSVAYEHPWNAGVLTTAGGLVFHGSSAGAFAAYDAATGKKLWETDVQTGVIAPAVTYEVDGEQYISLSAGYGGAFGLSAGWPTRQETSHPVGRMLVYKLGGEAELPALPEPVIPPRPPEQDVKQKEIDKGELAYHTYCSVCHGSGAVSGGVLPDLRHMTAETHAQFKNIVLKGTLTNKGMVSFAQVLTEDDAQRIHAYLIQRAHQDYPY
ncbi:MAG: PQQ-dependent dehydrogenase, methanol/ethanol family [Gammaproteobacteria bacterium]